MKRDRYRIYYIREVGSSVPIRVTWRQSSKTSLYHATADGRKPVCGAPTELDLDGSPYGLLSGFATQAENDDARSRDCMACSNCEQRVLCRVVTDDKPEVLAPAAKLLS